MSRKPIIAGNWKMNKNPQEAQAFVEAIAGKLPAGDKIEAAIVAPAVDLNALLWFAKDSELKVAAKTATLKMQVPSLVKLLQKYWLKWV